MSKKLAIRGHSTRGKEVIELLEMLGGKAIAAKGCDETAIYVIPNNGIIDVRYTYKKRIDNYAIFTLEEFLEKYPFKVGDKVFDKADGCPGIVTEIKWDEDVSDMKYCVTFENGIDFGWFVNDSIDFLNVKEMKNVLTELLNHIKNTPKEELEREFEEIKEWSNVGPTVEEFMTFCECVNKKPKYPITYDECCEVLMGKTNFSEFSLALIKYSNTIKFNNSISPDAPHIELFNNLYKIIICCDAYWKIAGEEMSLGKPWKPDWSTGDEIKYVIEVYRNNVRKNSQGYSNTLLAFPTPEMRDAFYENFKNLIEQCKELL